MPAVNVTLIAVLIIATSQLFALFCSAVYNGAVVIWRSGSV